MKLVGGSGSARKLLAPSQALSKAVLPVIVRMAEGGKGVAGEEKFISSIPSLVSD